LQQKGLFEILTKQGIAIKLNKCLQA
jgi:hypothetical protein